MNLADILAEIYVLESTYLRVEKLKSQKDMSEEINEK